MKLVSIPSKKFEKYRIDAIFDCYKWDPQFLDNNTLAKHVLVISEDECLELAKLTEKLDFETREAEEFLSKNLDVAKNLNIPKKIYANLFNIYNYDFSNNIRLTRYDFHPTVNQKWSVSEVNSDVPGGFAEASLLPKLAIKTLNMNKCYSIDFGEILAKRISKKIKENGNIMFLHCTSYSDDRQVMQYIGDKMDSLGYNVIYGAADHLKFVDKKAVSILDSYEMDIDLIFRFTPLEWLKDMKNIDLAGYFDTVTSCCNHPIAIFAQTKRFPLIWETLEKNGIKLNTWKKLLPETREVGRVVSDNEYVYKPAYGRVGENISVKEACSNDEYKKILKDVSKNKKKYLMQKKFISKPIKSDDGQLFHVCIGSYAVDGKHAGFYARISDKPLIDSGACDIPVIIERSKKNG